MANTFTKKPENIALGKGIFKVDDVCVGLTRDGGNFSVEFNNRKIEADGDRGAVKGRIIREEATPKLKIKHLELLTNFEDRHPGVKVDTSTKEGYTTMKGTGKIDDENDYHTVEYVGETKDGRELTIKIKNAINLENISLDLKDKDEILDEITYTGCYDENRTDDDELWEVTYKTSK